MIKRKSCNLKFVQKNFWEVFLLSGKFNKGNKQFFMVGLSVCLPLTLIMAMCPVTSL